ncbi:MAG: ECF transporter S component [Clostridia bacterium]|nr:ECF transporter S component [Clostridia bacterium]
MKTNKQTGEQTKKLVLTALLTAIVALLSYFGGFIKIGGLASISLTLIPVVLGAALCGPWVGTFLGFISGLFFLFNPADSSFWINISPLGTIFTVLLKGALCGLCAGLVYMLLEKVNRYFAVIVSAIVCPVVNTGIFLIGCRLFFWDTVVQGAADEGKSVIAYLLVAFVGFNFVFELIVNIILSPAILRIINIRKRMN